MKIFVVSYKNPDWAYDYSWKHKNPGVIKVFCSKEKAKKFIKQITEKMYKEDYFADGLYTVFDPYNYKITEVECI